MSEKVLEKQNSQDKKMKQSEDHYGKLIILKNSSYGASLCYYCDSLVCEN